MVVTHPSRRFCVHRSTVYRWRTQRCIVFLPDRIKICVQCLLYVVYSLSLRKVFKVAFFFLGCQFSPHIKTFNVLGVFFCL